MQPEQPIVVGEAVALDLRLAGVASRGLAAIVDLAISYVALFLLEFLALAIASGGADIATVLTLFLVVYVGVLIGYPVISETLWRGRTVGKAMMGIRVVRDDGGPIRFRHALVRGLLGTLWERPGATLGVAAVLPMLFTQRTKRCGDLLAGTVVVRDRVPARYDVVVQMPGPLAGWAASLDLSGVDDSLAARLREFIGRAGALHPGVRQQMETELATAVVARVGPPPDGTPTWAFLTAVLAERRNRAARAANSP